MRRAPQGNIWAVTLVTGNPTNVLLAEDLGDSFLSFAARMGLPGIAAGLTSFALMYWTNRHKVSAVVADRPPHGRSVFLPSLWVVCPLSPDDQRTPRGRRR